jgi:hypothetical protein
MAVSSKPIALTLGFANFAGDTLEPLRSEDSASLSPLFETVRQLPPGNLPDAHVLFVYADLEEDGSIAGSPGRGIRQVAEKSGAKIVVLASPNPTNRIIRTGKLAGSYKANFVFTLNRKGSGFARFFHSLFDDMRDGTNMLSAWVKLAPQGGTRGGGSDWAPDTILAAEAGKVVFPHERTGGGLFGLFGRGKRD